MRFACIRERGAVRWLTTGGLPMHAPGAWRSSCRLTELVQHVSGYGKFPVGMMVVGMSCMGRVMVNNGAVPPPPATGATVWFARQVMMRAMRHSKFDMGADGGWV